VSPTESAADGPVKIHTHGLNFPLLRVRFQGL